MALVPAVIAVVVSAFTDFSPVNPGARAFLFWTPVEVGIWASLAAAGLILSSYYEFGLLRKHLGSARKSEEKRRAIAAVGVAANWDLDLLRLYQRVSQDFRSLIPFERFVITAALPTGRMRIEFVNGPEEEGFRRGEVLPLSPEEPDGLFPEYRQKYGSRLTVAVPACNGMLTIRCSRCATYSQEDLDTLREAVAQISPGIANAIMFRASERRVTERTTLAEIGRVATSALGTQGIIKEVDSLLGKLISYDHLGVALVADKADGPDSGDIVYWSRPGVEGLESGDRVKYAMSPYTRQVEKGRVFRDTLDDAETVDGLDTRRTWLQAPLLVRDELIGVLVISSADLAAFEEDETDLLLSVSRQVAPAIQNAFLAESLHRQSEERRVIAAIGYAANSELMLDSIYNSITEELSAVLQFDRLSIARFEPETKVLKLVFVDGFEIEGFRVGDAVPLANIDELPETSDIVSWADAPSDFSPLVKTGGLNSLLFAALGAPPQLLGSIQVSSRRENAYTPQDAELLERVATQVTPAIRNALTIAAERELRETLDRQNKELFAANNARKQFLSTVSHELRTPLTIISGFIDLLASPDSGQDEAERGETLGIIRRNTDHLGVLINDILDISRIDAGTFKINPKPFSAVEMVRDLEASFQSLLRTKTQTLRVICSEDELWINADRSRISQVITNLLSNASKYSPEGTEVTLGCVRAGDRLHIQVIDRGSGMTREQQDGLFTPFYRVDNEATRSVPGTGLGLVIAKSITELHAGEINLQSEPGNGTTVEFWLPGILESAEIQEEPEAAEPFTGSRLWPDRPPDDLQVGAD